MSELPPPRLARREPERTEWVVVVEARRWYSRALAWIVGALVAVAVAAFVLR